MTSSPTPSGAEGLPWETEERFRFLGCQLIQHAGLLLKLPQSAMLTAQHLLHQLYSTLSLLQIPVLDAAMAALFVAGKVEECYRRARDVVNVFHWLHGRMRKGKGPERLPYICDEYYGWRDRLTRTEMILLRALGFHVQPESKTSVLLLISYLQALDNLPRRCPKLGQLALNLLNDSFRTPLCLRHPPPVLACAALGLAAEHLGWQDVLPAEEACWYVVFGVEDPADMAACMQEMGRSGSVRYDPDLPMTPDELDVYARVLKDILGQDPSRERMERDKRSDLERERRGDPERERTIDPERERRGSRRLTHRSRSRSRSPLHARSRSKSRSRSRSRSRTRHRSPHRHRSHRYR